MNIRSIHVRLIFWYTALVIAVSAGFGGYTYYSLYKRLYSEMNQTLSRRIEHMRDDILSNIANYTPKALSQRIQDVYSPEENDRFIRVSKIDGTTIYVSGMPLDKSFDPSRIPLPKDYTSTISERMEQLRSREHILLNGFVTNLAGKKYIVEMGAPTSEIDSALRKLIITLLIGLPIITVLAVAGGSLLVHQALQPVEKIRATAEKITFSDTQNRLPVSPSGDALEHLSHTLNQMLERLDLAYQQASQFSADASHELRTPLAIMRSELESVMNARDLPSAFRGRVGSILEETERLSGIVEGLFSIVRLNAGEGKIRNDIFNLSELVLSTLEQMQLLADEKQQLVKIESPSPVFIRGDSARMKQVIVNLLDNAIKYTSVGGIITLSVNAVASKAVITIMDNGIGISAEEIPKVFERFYRADRNRSSQGAGLGLSIVRAICQAHGGAVNIQSLEGVGSTVTVELPVVDTNNKGNLHAAA